MARKLTVRLWDILAEQESDVLAYLNSINDKNNSAIKSIVDEVNQINVDMESKVTDANYVHTDNNYTTVEKQKLQGIADNANKYVHPLTHNADMIVEDANKRFVSDTEMGNKLEVSNIIAGTNIALDKVGNNVTINSTASGGGDYVLPTASATVKGGIKVGSGLTMTGDVLSATGGGGSVDLTKVSTNIVPTTNSTLDIGSPTNRFKTLYCDEAKLSTNTLYIGDVPVLGTDNGNIMVKADPNQNLSVKTTGMGNLGIHSSNITEMLSDGVGGGVNVKAMGTNGTVNITSASGRIEMTAPTINMSGNTTTGNLTIGGNLTVQGTTTTVDSANLSIADNIVELNKGETGQGVSKLQAGIKIKRGDLQDQHIVFDEASDRWKVGEGTSLKNITTDDMIPTKVSQLTNDSGYLTTLPTHNHNELYYSKAEVDGKIPVIDVNKQYVDTQDTLLDGKITENTNKIGDLSTLTTTNKSNLVGAINELDNDISTLSRDKMDLAGGVFSGTVRISSPSVNHEQGFEGGDGDSASFEKCAFDLFSWNGIGFYPKAGGKWGDGKQGRSVFIDTRQGIVHARGNMFIANKQVATVEKVSFLSSGESNPNNLPQMVNQWKNSTSNAWKKLTCYKIGNVGWVVGVISNTGVVQPNVIVCDLPIGFRPINHFVSHMLIPNGVTSIIVDTSGFLYFTTEIQANVDIPISLCIGEVN